jgi:hypothetical protein
VDIRGRGLKKLSTFKKNKKSKADVAKEKQEGRKGGRKVGR